ncbi:GGDEF domain-containing protein [Solihabitans fulvus]|uniref:GGDEF domain-containing protein n=1 Tax=Solihabitans fulvus TaxID=1892852 RepID=A0A5B2XWR0_9PSEU|nr:GGDEF domain-containing protein [Solihabitans fulvus]KAA2267124.1 GGDEF domain-containing protein [Solihabitans fulvus]
MSPRRWSLLAQRPRLIGYVLLVETTALALTAATAATVSIRPREVAVLAALAGMGVLQAELGRQVERVRRRVNNTPHINMTSVWTFAGVLLLPTVLVAVLVATLYLHLAVRSWYRLRRVPAFRTVFNSCLVILTCHAAGFVLARTGIDGMDGALDRGWTSIGALALAAVTYFLVGALVAVPGLSVTSRSFQELFGGWADNLLEVATLCLGMLTALALATFPALAAVVIPPLLLLHRGVLVKQLEVAATTDEKTGLFNTLGWHNLASHELTRAKRDEHASFGVLMVDLDHFKLINDRHGHLAGDTVLKAVATTIGHAVRDYDSVGRFGGEEFVVLLPDIAETEVVTVAERIRDAVARLEVEVADGDEEKVITGLSASIGVATYPGAGTVVERLLQAADTALYEAKNTGRNKVVSIVDVA